MNSHCVVVQATGNFVHKERWDAKETDKQSEIDILKRQIAELQEDRKRQIIESKRQTTAAIKSYRSALNSGYDWTEGTGWFANSTVESVQDDGRFTYIRLTSDSRGILSILADIDGQQEMLEKTYDATKREYKVAGVYPRFKLKAGESEVTITRRGR